MNREQAIEVLISRYNSGVIRGRIDDDEWLLATETAIAALREPAHEWVRTTDRLPTEAELGPCGHVRVCDKDGHTGIALYAEFRLHPREYPYWHPLLKAPQDAEKEEKDDNSHRAIQRGEA